MIHSISGKSLLKNLLKKCAVALSEICFYLNAEEFLFIFALLT